MIYDLNKAMEFVQPWDLKVKDGPTLYPTKPVTNAQIARLTQIQSMPVEEQRKLLAEFFEDPNAIDALVGDKLADSISVIIAYVQGRAQKKAAWVTDQVIRQMRMEASGK